MTVVEGEPAFVDATAVETVAVSVIGVEFDAQAGLEKGAQHPRGREPEQAASAGVFIGDFGGRVGFDGAELIDSIRAWVSRFRRGFAALPFRGVGPPLRG